MTLARAIDTTDAKTALAALEALVAAAKATHPDLGLSLGYIGNLERWGDDRDWRVFTNRQDSTGRSISFHLGGYASLTPALADMAATYLPKFLARASEATRR